MAESPLEVKEEFAPPVPEEEEGEDLEIPDDLIQESPPTSQQPPTGGGETILFRDRFLVNTGRPLPQFDSPSAKAYDVEDRRDLGYKLFGLVCSPGLSVRGDLIKLFQSEQIQGFLQLIDWGVIDWRHLGQKTMLVIYEQPLGGRVIDRLARKEVKITEYDITRRIIEPLTASLQRLNSFNKVHRNIRPRNIYFLDEEMDEVVFGECVTTPSGHDQPAVYEPLERSMCSPGGRGSGDQFDDVFALGVTLLYLTLGYNPVSKLKPEELIYQRIEHGTYATLCGGARIPLSLLEPFRGMMSDDRVERWGYSEIAKWLDGQTMTPIQKRPAVRAEVPFIFLKKEHFNTKTLTRDFTLSPLEAMKVIREEAFHIWIRRNLNMPELAERIIGLVQSVDHHKDGFQGTDDFLLLRTNMILNPSAPIYYKGMTFMPDGIGSLLASEWLSTGSLQVSSEILRNDICHLWFEAQQSPLPSTNTHKKVLEQLKGIMAIKDIGYGIERVFYELCPSLPCQSPLIAKQYVMEIEGVLPALEEASNHTDTSTKPIDRHVAAFIAAHFKQDIHPHLRAMASPKPETAIIGILSLLALLQWKLKVPSLLGISSWVGGLLGPAIETYHNRQTRRDIEKDIPKLVRQGSLPEIFELIDNAEKRQSDTDGYSEAVQKYADAQHEIDDIEGAGSERLTKAERSGQQAAATISIVITFMVITMLVIAEFW